MGAVYSGYPNGRVGQMLGPVSAGTDVIPLIRKQFNIVDYKGLLKLGIQAPEYTFFELNGQRVRIGKTGMYELDYSVLVQSLIFETDLDDVQIDFVY